MKLWATHIYAKCAATGDLKTFDGPNVSGATREDAQRGCFENGLGYCHVIGEVDSREYLTVRELDYLRKTVFAGARNSKDSTWEKAFAIYNKKTNNTLQTNCAKCYGEVLSYLNKHFRK